MNVQLLRLYIFMNVQPLRLYIFMNVQPLCFYIFIIADLYIQKILYLWK